MFSQVSVCPRGGYLGRSPRAGTPPKAGTPPWTGTPAGRYTPWAGTPLPQCMLGYGQQAGGTHPTGMHSCLIE